MDPETLDLVSLSGSDDTARDRFLEWDCAESAVDGCISLQDPRPLVSKAPMSKAPFLALLDALVHQGYSAVPGKVTHEPQGPKAFAASATAAAYLRCVLIQERLFEAGCRGFDSAQSGAYYEVLLRTPTAAPGRSAAEYRKMLKKATWPKDLEATLDSKAAPAPLKPRQCQIQLLSPPDKQQPPAPPMSTDSDSSDTSASSSSSSSSSSSNNSLTRVVNDSDSSSRDSIGMAVFPLFLLGQTLSRQQDVTFAADRAMD